MKKIATILLIFSCFSSFSQMIIDHNCIDLSDIPLNWIDSAKQNLFIGYGHTSHGSQIPTGMDAIVQFYTDGTYDWSHDGGQGILHLFEGDGYGDGDLDHDCGYTGWDDETRDYLDANPDCNVIIWSWCGQVNDVNLQSHYLTPMTQLESEYPDVQFVYMTGHLEGLGPDGSLFQANQQIRTHCQNNGKILFDFTDIEKYDPDAEVNYQQYYADDGCNYDHPEGGTANWANDWLDANPDDLLTSLSDLCGSCAHSVSLNCVKKGIAAWFLWARLAGWDGTVTGTNIIVPEDNVKIIPNPFRESISIDANNTKGIDHIEIIDICGNIVYSNDEQTEDHHLTIDLSHLPAGVYITRISTGQKTLYKKIIKE